MAKAPATKKMEAMILHAQGMSLQAIATQLGFNKSTICDWKQAKDPEDWDQFAKEMLHEALNAAKQKIRLEAAEELGKSWQDVSKLRSVAKVLAGRLAQKLGGGKDSDGKELPMSIDIAEAILCGQRLSTMFRNIQDQQFGLIGVPNLRIDTGSGSRTPAAKTLSDAEIEQMDERDLMRYISTFADAAAAPAESAEE